MTPETGGGVGDASPVDDRLAAVLDSFAQRCRRGESPSVSEYAAEHPDLAPRIRELFPALALLEGASGQDGQPVSASDPTPAPSIPTSRRLGEYRLLREIGRGGMGVVYEAEQESLGRRVALKVLPFHSLMRRERIERFHREARAAALLRHRGIVPIHGLGVHDGIHFYAMQLVEGQSLDRVLPELRRLTGRTGSTAATGRGPLGSSELSSSATVAARLLGFSPVPTLEPVAGGRVGPGAGEPDSTPALRGGVPAGWTQRYHRNIARVGLEAADALAHAHGHGVIHRDIKPSNLIVDEEGRTWVVDFGLAKALDDGEITRTGEILGTPRYMAPEQARGEADPRSDVYSLGLTLHELLTLEPSRGGLHEPTPPRSIDPRVPRDLEAIVLRATRGSPADRYPSAAAMATDLQRFLDGGRGRVRPAGPGSRGPPRRAGRVVRAVALLLATILAAVLAAAWALAHRPTMGQQCVAADVDADGDADVISVNAGSRSISLLRNGGGGRFSVAGHFQVGDTPTSAAIADLDGDGDLDIATSDFRSRSISLIENLRGAGLRLRSPLDLGSGVNSVAAGDLDGDGKADLLAATTEAGLRLLRGAGNMTFAAPEAIGTAASPPNVVILGDVDRDGRLDAIATNGADLATTTLSVFRNQGVPSFARTDHDLGHAPWGLAVDDMDGDGLLDLAVAHPLAAYLSILRNRGGGAFGEPARVSVSSPVQSLCSGDFDGDGRIDLAGAGGGDGTGAPARVCVILGLEGGGFAPPRDLPAGGRPSSVAAVDLDGDRLLDLVSSNYQDCRVVWFPGDGTGGFGGPRAVDLAPWWRPVRLSRR